MSRWREGALRLPALLLALWASSLIQGQDQQPVKPGGTSNATPNNRIAYFSWYSGPSERPDKEHTNLATHGNLTFLRQSFEELGVPAMLRLDQSQWGMSVGASPWIHVTHPVFEPGAAGLTATWKAAVDDCIATVTPLAKRNGGFVHGIQLGDELVCNGFPLSNLTALSARLHDGLHKHDVFIYTNECFNQGAECKTDSDCGPPARGGKSGGGSPVCMREGSPGVVFAGCQAAVWPQIPDGIDAISLDIYFQFPDRLPNGSYFGGGSTEVSWAKSFYNKYFLPLLKPHQSVWLVPGLFGSNVSRDGGFGPTMNHTVINTSAMVATDENLAEKLSDYWAWASTEPRITGVLAWHWEDYPVSISIPTMRWGGDAYPKTLAFVKARVSELPPTTATGLR
eukprot:COSAG02_NODE_1650_length_11487_cov_13.602895_13_plen_396_part_00